MPAYTITRETLLALAKVRRRQIKEAKEQRAKALDDLDALEKPHYALFVELRAVDRAFRSRLLPAWAFVRMVNGATVETALPVRRIAEWVRLAAANTFAMAISGPPFFTKDAPGLLLQGGPSKIKFYGQDQVSSGNGYSRRHDTPAAWLGEPITLTAPPEGGEFKLS